MDAERFDSLTRSLNAGRSRRGVAWLLSGVVLGGPLVVAGLAETQAKRKKKKKKRRPPPLPSDGCPQGQKLCQGTCIASNQCCTDSDCGDTAPRCCRGTCLRPSECCTTSDCAGGKTCQTGTCVCPPDKPHDDCPDSSECRRCCTVDDCRVDEVGRSDGLACRDGQCVCTIPGTRQCGFGGQMRCDVCCSDSECPNNLRCDFDAIDPARCGCPSAIRCGDTCVSCSSNTMCSAQCFNIGQPCCAPFGDLPGLFCREVGDPGSGVAFCQL